MGLTIHYTLRSRVKSDAKALELVERLRQRALDLPFESVSELYDCSGAECDFEARRAELQGTKEKPGSDPALFWMLIQATESVPCPWNKHHSRGVTPDRVLAFQAWPGRGCEACNIGLCRYPATIPWEYTADEDQRFFTRETPDAWPRMSWLKYRKFCDKNPGMAATEMRQVRTKLGGWRWNSFCKTQYASDPGYGGVPNFLRCHLGVVALLDHAKKLKLLEHVSDEGDYWEKRDPQALAQEVGSWNSMIAGVFGMIKDAVEGHGDRTVLEGEIQKFRNFEHLEAKGREELEAKLKS